MTDFTDVQGNILRGYRMPRVRYLILEVAERFAARRWLAASTSGGGYGVPQITPRALGGQQAGHLLQHWPDLRGTARARHAGLFTRDVPE